MTVSFFMFSTQFFQQSSILNCILPAPSNEKNGSRKISLSIPPGGFVRIFYFQSETVRVARTLHNILHEWYSSIVHMSTVTLYKEPHHSDTSTTGKYAKWPQQCAANTTTLCAAFFCRQPFAVICHTRFVSAAAAAVRYLFFGDGQNTRTCAFIHSASSHSFHIARSAEYKHHSSASRPHSGRQQQHQPVLSCLCW